LAQVSYTVVSSKQISGRRQDAQKAPRYRVSAMRLVQVATPASASVQINNFNSTTPTRVAAVQSIRCIATVTFM
jgi:hypothetical protein